MRREHIHNDKQQSGTRSVNKRAPDQKQHVAGADNTFIQLQRTLGNKTVQRLLAEGRLSSDGQLIQAKMTVNTPGDAYEQEADQVAQRVMNTPDAALQREDALEDEEQFQQMPIQGEEVLEDEALVQEMPIQREETFEDEEVLDDENLLQAKADAQVPDVTMDVERQIEQKRGGGQALPDHARDFFEPRFGQDFSGVNIHADSEADGLTHSLQAKAFTTGSDIFFRSGEYQPDSTGGRELLAHELTHVVQQGAATRIARKAVSRSVKGSEAETFRINTWDNKWEIASRWVAYSLLEQKSIKLSQIAEDAQSKHRKNLTDPEFGDMNDYQPFSIWDGPMRVWAEGNSGLWAGAKDADIKQVNNSLLRAEILIKGTIPVALKPAVGESKIQLAEAAKTGAEYILAFSGDMFKSLLVAYLVAYSRGVITPYLASIIATSVWATIQTGAGEFGEWLAGVENDRESKTPKDRGLEFMMDLFSDMAVTIVSGTAKTTMSKTKYSALAVEKAMEILEILADFGANYAQKSNEKIIDEEKLTGRPLTNKEKDKFRREVLIIELASVGGQITSIFAGKKLPIKAGEIN